MIVNSKKFSSILTKTLILISIPLSVLILLPSSEIDKIDNLINPEKEKKKEVSSILIMNLKASQAFFTEYNQLAKSTKDIGEYISVTGCKTNDSRICRNSDPEYYSDKEITRWYSPTGNYEIEMKSENDQNIFIATPTGKFKKKGFGVSGCFNSKNGKAEILEMSVKGTNIEIASCSVISTEETISPKEMIYPEENSILDLRIKYQEHSSKSSEIYSNFIACYNSADLEKDTVLSLEMKNKCQAERFKAREMFNKELNNIQDQIDKLNNP